MSDDNNSPAPPRETTGKNFRILDGAAMPPDVDISDTQWALVEYDGDQMVRIVGVDGGEPEDQTLVRDWNWVAVEMNALARQLRASEDARRKAEARAERWATHAVDVERERDTARAELEAVRRERDEANVSLRSLRTELWEGAREHGLTAPLQGSESARLIAAYCGGIVKAREERDAAANEREEWRRAADYHAEGLTAPYPRWREYALHAEEELAFERRAHEATKAKAAADVAQMAGAHDVCTTRVLATEDALAAERQAHEATKRKVEIAERFAEAAADRADKTEAIAQERDRAEAALATVTKAIAAIEISEYAGRGVVVCRRCNAASSTLTGIKHEPECDAPALAAALGEPQPRECSCNIERDGCGGSGWKAPGIQCRKVAAPPTSTAEERCATCKGSGRSPHADDECRNCDGRGSYQTAEQRVEALEAALRTLITRAEALLTDYSELHDNDVKHELFAAPTEAAIETARAALSTGGKGGA
jgi:hypothetical protein